MAGHVECLSIRTLRSGPVRAHIRPIRRLSKALRTPKAELTEIWSLSKCPLRQSRQYVGRVIGMTFILQSLNFGDECRIVGFSHIHQIGEDEIITVFVQVSGDIPNIRFNTRPEPSPEW
jgi:hypothetical protein